MRGPWILRLVILWWWLGSAAAAVPLSRDELTPLIVPPYALGENLDDRGVWGLLNSGGAEAGYVLETGNLAPLPGFSGAPINLLVMIDLEGRFLDVKLIAHNEPIFVSGLGEAPFRAFLEQYRGHSIHEPLVVGTPYGTAGGGSDLVYLDGVTKATASVRIAHESILAATLAVARERMQGIAAGPPVRPDPDVVLALDWAALVERGLARNLRVSNAELDQAFAGTVWADDDPEADADPEAMFLDLWVVDIGPPSVARAVLTPDSLGDVDRLTQLSPDDELLLVIDAGRHGLVSDGFVRNTAPDRLSAEQDGLPVALRDADLLFETLPDVPEGSAMILRVDRRLGFDPTRDWVLTAQAVRAHGMLQPEMGSQHFSLITRSDPALFRQPETRKALPPWQEALLNRKIDLILLVGFLIVVLALVGPSMHALAAPARLTPVRLAVLAGVIGFVGWWGQGQLSIVTALAVLRAAVEGGSLAVLVYDPFSLLVWAVAILGLFLWGRGLFCGWLCPFGAMQEFAHHAGRLLRLPEWNPSARWDRRLKWVKYVALAGLVAVAFVRPDAAETAAEIEPFKTAVTTFFQREWYFVAYALFWLGLGMVTFKGFCRYLCPLGALMALGGVLRLRKWIPRRAECGTPCQLCRVRCRYGAIERSGKIDYSECFQCLDCVSIHDDKAQCVPLILAARRRSTTEAA
ncbi:regulatory protein NosR [Gemmobacter aquaticus]|uniref:Regulatory protein NosR n=1 Tax=Gemmobacter aquaticus TaxID=490185 RepID=A0A917YIB6_9RHOB|nr:4Fe-4S binding protein [Gemmobacter aquaticus]GGO27911.1 regulatory protein NosR [Gemmobacter aquaticus]